MKQREQTVYMRIFLTLWKTRLCLTLAMLALDVVAGPMALGAPTTSRHISNRELRAEKHGRVVDADTGAGIPNALVIVDWRTLSTGVPGLIGGGTWCDLQRIVTTDEHGEYTIPDVSHDLDISDRGTHRALTPGGMLASTHDVDWVVVTYKPGYVRLADMEFIELARTNWIGGLVGWPTTPDVGFAPGKVVIKPMRMRKMVLDAMDEWHYDALILAGAACSDRMAQRIEQPEIAGIRASMGEHVRAMPCAMPADTAIDSAMLNSFLGFANDRAVDKRMVEIIGRREWGTKGTTAGVVCQALNDKGTGP